MSEFPIPRAEFDGVPDDRRPGRTRADKTRQLITETDLGPIKAHMAVAQGEADDILADQESGDEFW